MLKRPPSVAERRGVNSKVPVPKMPQVAVVVFNCTGAMPLPGMSRIRPLPATVRSAVTLPNSLLPEKSVLAWS